MRFLKSIKKTLLFIALAYIAMGVLMILGKADYKEYLCLVLAGGVGIAGLLEVIRYFLIPIEDRIKRNDFMIGILLVAVGIFLYFDRESLGLIVNNMTAILIIILGLVLIQDLLDIHACVKKQNAFYSFIIIIAIGLGVLTYFNPFEDLNTSYMIMGVSMIYIGIVNIISNFNVAVCVAAYEKRLIDAAKQQEEEKEEKKEEIVPEVKENVVNDDIPLDD